MRQSGRLARAAPWRGQPDLAAERSETRIVLEAHDEGVEEQVNDTWVTTAPRPIEPVKGLLGIITQRIDLRDLVGGSIRLIVDQRLECRIGSTSVAADLPREGERDLVPTAVGFLLRGGERGSSITALDFDDRKLLVIASRPRL